MLIDVTSVKPLDGYCLELAFEDGKRGVYDVTPLLDQGVFRALRDKALFDRVSVKHGTVSWPHELDIAPETLYEDCVPAGTKQ